MTECEDCKHVIFEQPIWPKMRTVDIKNGMSLTENEFEDWKHITLPIGMTFEDCKHPGLITCVNKLSTWDKAS